MVSGFVRTGVQCGILKAVSIVRSHYPFLGYEVMGRGWCPRITLGEVTLIEAEMQSVAEGMLKVLEDEAVGDEETAVLEEPAMVPETQEDTSVVREDASIGSA